MRDGLYALQTPWWPSLRERAPGQGLVEYVLILGFISVVVIVALIYFREQLIPLYSKVGNSLT